MKNSYKNKRKLANVPKYDMGGDINDPNYMEYLSRTGQTPESIKQGQLNHINQVNTQNNRLSNENTIAGGLTTVGTAINPLLGAAIGIGSNLLLNNQKEKNQKANIDYQKKQEDELNRQQTFYKDKTDLSSYSLKGKQGVEYFNAMGGNITPENNDNSGQNLDSFINNNGNVLNANKDYFLARVNQIGYDKATQEYNGFFGTKKKHKKKK